MIARIARSATLVPLAPLVLVVLVVLCVVLCGVTGSPAAGALDPPAATPREPRIAEDGSSTGADFCSRSRTAASRMRADRTEPTPNQRMWDARSYALDLRLEPDSSWVEGVARIRLLALESLPDSLRSVELDLTDSLEVRHVLANDVWLSPEQIAHVQDLITLQLPQAAAPGSAVTLQVGYRGRVRSRETEGLHFARPGQRTLIYTFGGPRGARRWWPCKDHPEDKADSVLLRANVPDSLELVANGRLRSRTPAGDRVTFEWLEAHPIATYLVAFAAYPYSVYEEQYQPVSGGPGMPIVFYNYPESRPTWEPVQSKVKSMLGTFAPMFGEYPFLDEKYGHAQIPFSGGMEHQTITSLGSKDELVVAHELAHQWWGDEITCADYHDVWLNEGFATYAEALYLEEISGREAYVNRMRTARYFGPGSIYVPDVGDPDRLYDLGLSYSKGAWVLHMLRHITGDEAFFEILRLYRARQRDQGAGVARTADLAAVASEIAGRDLRPFFDRWILGEGYPIYRYDWSAEPVEGMWRIHLRIRQVQDEPVFPMPIDIEIRSEADIVATRETVWNAVADSTYVLSTPERPASVGLDPDEWILRRVLGPLPPLVSARPVLLVNGVPWSGEAGQRTAQQYAKDVFTGGLDFDFWDVQDSANGPDGGYPSELPAPLGHGAVPGEVLARYQAVIWVGNNFGRDFQAFLDTPLHAYLEAGGNVLLMAPSGRTMLIDPYREYLGVEWAEGDSIARSYSAMRAGLPDLAIRGDQRDASYFRVDPGADKILLYAEDGDPSRALGVVRLPELDAPAPAHMSASKKLPGAGSDIRVASSGHFVFLSGRAYRWLSDDLRAALGTLTADYLLAPPGATARLEVRPPWPNPSGGASRIAFLLPAAERVRLALFDVTGRRVRVLRDADSPAGWNAEIWDGRDAAGRRAPSGIYFARVDAGGHSAVARVLRAR